MKQQSIDQSITDIIFPEGKYFAHNQETGIIYTMDRKTKVMDLKKLTGNTALPIELYVRYNIMSYYLEGKR